MPHYRAVLFDMDGLMFDTERLARMGWEGAFAENGFTLDDVLYLRLVGRTIPDVAAILQAEFGEEFPFERIYGRRQQIYEDHLTCHGVPYKPGLMEVLDFLRAHQVPLAVASSTPRAFGRKKIESSGLQDRFQAVAFGDEVAHGKPAPDIFLLAADRLGYPPKECIVIEDSEAGIQAAHAAGALPLMVPDLKQPAPEIRSLAFGVFETLEAAIPVLAEQLALNSSPSNPPQE